MKMYPIGPSKRPNYLQSKIYPSNETKKVLKLASEVNLIEKQTKFIKNNNLKAKDLSLNSFLNKRINIL